jgi:hypothetical protein
MIIKISPDLATQEYWANGVELASIMGRDRSGKKRVLTYPASKKIFVHAMKNPVLLTDTYRIAKLDPTVRDTLFSLITSRPRIVEYDGVSVSWDDTHINVWCPSIDTVLLAKALGKVLKKGCGFRDAVELGCGSGFLSKYALKKCKSIRSLLVNDINPYAIKCAMDNIDDKRALFYTGNGMEKIKGGKFDLMICNPPYVPRPSSIDDNPYEGVGLLNHLVHDGQKYLNKGGALVINISSLCKDQILNKKPSMKMTVLEKMKVPLKVNNILNNKSWLDYLVNERGLKKKYKNGYEYWQEIIIVKLANI